MTKTAGTARHMRSEKAGGGIVPVICHALGTLLIMVALAMTLPLTVPRMLGYEVFDVISGSMEPEIPVGSVIYVRAVEPSDVQAEEVIAFYGEDSVVAHRVVENRTSRAEFVTKGDANDAEDLSPIAYDALIGVVVLHVPLAGGAMALYASNVGKMCLMLTLACGVLLNLLGDSMRRSGQVRPR